MVFHSISGEEKPEAVETKTDERVLPPPMASSPLKSQPLHNFPLPDLKWSANQPNNHRFRKPARLDADSDSENRKSNEAVEGEKNGSAANKVEEKKMELIGGSDVAVEKWEKKSAAVDGGKSKILIRFRANNQKPVVEAAEAGDEIQKSIAEEAEELEAKTWNLRPRKPIQMAGNAGGGVKTGKAAAQEIRSKRPELSRKKYPAEVKKEKQPKFSISLTREEIEDDFAIMTGSRPSRKPKRRAKNVQKQLDNLFPGMWLSSITPDSYRVPEEKPKRGKNSLLAELE